LVLTANPKQKLPHKATMALRKRTGVKEESPFGLSLLMKFLSPRSRGLLVFASPSSMHSFSMSCLLGTQKEATKTAVSFGNRITKRKKRQTVGNYFADKLSRIPAITCIESVVWRVVGVSQSREVLKYRKIRLWSLNFSRLDVLAPLLQFWWPKTLYYFQ